MKKIQTLQLHTLMKKPGGDIESLIAEISKSAPLVLTIDLCRFPDKGEIIDVCEKLRSALSRDRLQIVVTAQKGGKDEDAVSFLNAGADDFVSTGDYYLASAKTRLEAFARLEGEKNFYKEVLYEEERLTFETMMRNLDLEDSYKKIQIKKKDLERAYEELLDIIKYDTLTGLLNRKSVFAMIDIEIERAQRLDFPLSAFMIDIDYFKSVNDKYGHQFGDRVLSITANVLKAGLRKYDQAGRYGGEEFFVILPNTSMEQASHIAERFRRSLESRSIKFEGEAVSVTASIGISEWRKGSSKEEWIGEADSALYQAKKLGRNRTVTWQPDC